NAVTRNDKKDKPQNNDEQQAVYNQNEAAKTVLRGYDGGCRRQPARGVDVRMRPSVRRMILRMRKITQSAGRTRQGHAIQQTG
ncbi:hypothetical protein AOQ78_26680, partial [Salmonella enterica subsp. enterica serovar Newport]|nr:hypothetical protein [Salmonella enterica subsp. enterica serovar Newport]